MGGVSIASGGKVLTVGGGGVVRAASGGGGGTPAVLTASDLEWVGVYKLPLVSSGTYGVEGNLNGSIGAFAIRRVSGALRFLFSGHLYEHDLFELEVGDTPSSTVGAATNPSTGSLTRFAGVQGSGTPTDSTWHKPTLNTYTGSTLDALWWDDTLGGLWWSYGHEYDTTGANEPVLGFTSFSGSSVSTIYGPWKLASTTEQGSKMARHWIVPVPDSFVTDYLTAGRTLATGCAITSGHGSNSWGPSLQAIDRPIPGTTTAGAEQSSTRLRWHAISGGRQTRNNDYSVASTFTTPPGAVTPDHHNDTIAPSGATGYWCDHDRLTGCTWINLADKVGVLWVGHQARGEQWYGQGVPPVGPDTGLQDYLNSSGGGHCTLGHWGRWWLLDPDALGRVANGTDVSTDTMATEIDPTAQGYSTDADGALATPTEPVSGQIIADQAYGNVQFEPSTRRLYIWSRNVYTSGIYTNQPVIQVWHVKE